MRLASAIVLFAAAGVAVTPVRAEPAGGVVPLRVMTYNIHSCKGRDGKIRPDRIAQVISLYHPDVVVLEEVRVGRIDARTVDRPSLTKDGVTPPPVGEAPLPPPSVIAPRTPANSAAPEAPAPFTDQPRVIAEANGMSYIFYPLVRTKTEDYGIALLSRRPVKLVRAENLPTLPSRRPLERRGAIWAEISVDGLDVQILGTHLGLNGDERMAQVDALTGPDWLGSEKFRGPFALCGDFNSRPSQSAYKKVARTAVDGPLSLLGGKVKATWPSSLPFFRIDHVFVPKSARTVAVDVPQTALTKVSSDHLPVIADLVFQRKTESRREINVPPKEHL